MSELPTYFADFLEEVRLPAPLRAQCEQAHRELRTKLMADAALSKVIISTFLQGSYRRHTGVRPLEPSEKVDVDVVVVTTIPTSTPPKLVIEQLFKPFLDANYPGQWHPNDRSIKIEPTGKDVSLDLVPTSAPSEVEEDIFRRLDPDFQIEARGDAERQPLLLREASEQIRKAIDAGSWQREPLMIPSRDLERWMPTHPLAQIYWTEQKNEVTSGHYINIVKAMKWWRKRHADGVYPKAYPLEHITGLNCPADTSSVAGGLTAAFEAIRDNYRHHAENGTVPDLRDHGVDQNVFRRITPEQFGTFWRLVDAAAGDARAALHAVSPQESAARWRALLGPEFPAPREPSFSPPSGPATPIRGGRFG